MQKITLSDRLSLPQVRFDCLSVATLLIFLWGWHWRVTGHLLVRDIVSVLFLVILYVAYGSLFTRLVAPFVRGVADIPFQVLTGYFVFNSLLFVISLCSPMGMALNLAVLSVIAVLGLLFLDARGSSPGDATAGEHLAGFIAIAISCIGATIWCGEAQMPAQSRDGVTLITIWHDVYSKRSAHPPMNS